MSNQWYTSGFKDEALRSVLAGAIAVDDVAVDVVTVDVVTVDRVPVMSRPRGRTANPWSRLYRLQSHVR